MGWIECNGMERDRVVELACSHGRKRSYSVLDLLCGARGFVSGFFSFCGLSSGFGPSLSRRRSSLLLGRSDRARATVWTRYGSTALFPLFTYTCCIICDGQVLLFSHLVLLGIERGTTLHIAGREWLWESVSR